MSVKKKKNNKYFRRRLTLYFSVILIVAFIININRFSVISKEQIEQVHSSPQGIGDLNIEKDIMSEYDISVPYPEMTSNTLSFDKDLVNSEYGVLIDTENNTILAQRGCNDKIYPASLTKIMTLIVAVENIKDLDSTFTMTYQILNPLINADASRAGFEEKENVKMIDLLYGAILPSGADATVGLAEAISGTEENFVKLMNEKAEQMGLKSTHFMNTSGLFDENHYSTTVEMAMILQYALKNDLCRIILSTYQYTTSATPQHPEGIPLESDMFSRMYGTEVENVTILGGKTGYTIEAGNCLASFAEKNGKEFIAVTTSASGRYKPIFDAFEIYRNYLS